MRSGKWIGSAQVVVAALLASGAAFAQQTPVALPGFELERLDLNPGGEGSLLLGTGGLLPQGSVRVSLLGHYERNPLAYLRDGESAAPVVRDRVTAHLAAAYAFTNWLELGLQVPVVMYQQGEDLTAQGIERPASFGLGTPLVNARVGLLSQRGGGAVDLALELSAGVPVGSAAALSGARGLRLQPKVMVGRDFGALRAGLEAGVLLQQAVVLSTGSEASADQVGNEVRGGVALSTTGDGLRGELDLRGAFALSRQPSAVEALVGLRYPVSNAAEVFALGGVGVGSMPGTPLFRVLAGVAFGDVRGKAAPAPAPVSRCAPGQLHEPKECPELDDDGDGVKNGSDKCPTEPGPALRQGCPVKAVAPAVLDADKDGIPDAEDKCPTEPGPASRHGCPFKDADKDGIEDGQDKCPNEPGPLESMGCPVAVDTDKDGTIDSEDACPTEAGPKELKGCPVKDADNDGVPDNVDNCPQQAGPAANQGCPKEEKQLVTLAREKLEIKGKVFFDSEKAKIQKRSFPLLTQVAKVLIAHQEIPTVQIEGHTDGRGDAQENRDLSQQRAEAVRQYLVDKGVAATRLVAKGYGADRPVDTNKTSKGRENNRRVEFIISTEKTDTMEAPKR